MLNKKITELSLELESLHKNLRATQNSLVNNKNDEIKDNNLDFIINKNKSELFTLIIFKFENSLNFSEELNILQNLNSVENDHLFEKIRILSDENYKGNIFLKNLFTQELDVFLKNSFSSRSNNILKNYLMKLIIIEPSKKNIIKSDEINYLKEINYLIDQKQYKKLYKKMINIKNYQIFFSGTLSQLNIAIEFKELIQKVS